MNKILITIDPGASGGMAVKGQYYVHVRDDLYKIPYVRQNGMRSNMYYKKRTCTYCGEVMMQHTSNERKSRRSYCSNTCRAAGAHNPDGSVKWKRGHKGHVMEKRLGHPAGDRHGYVAQHRLAVEDAINRPLKSTEQVHHINMKKHDNRLCNLHLMPSSSHHFKAHGSLNKCVSTLIERGIIKFNRKTLKYEIL